MFAEMEAIDAAMVSRGFSIDEIDRMELWQVARALGVGGGPGWLRGVSLRSLPDGGDNGNAAPIDPDQWGETPEAVAGQEALKRLAGG